MGPASHGPGAQACRADGGLRVTVTITVPGPETARCTARSGPCQGVPSSGAGSALLEGSGGDWLLPGDLLASSQPERSLGILQNQFPGLARALPRPARGRKGACSQGGHGAGR